MDILKCNKRISFERVPDGRCYLIGDGEYPPLPSRSCTEFKLITSTMTCCDHCREMKKSSSDGKRYRYNLVLDINTLLFYTFLFQITVLSRSYIPRTSQDLCQEKYYRQLTQIVLTFGIACTLVTLIIDKFGF